MNSNTTLRPLTKFLMTIGELPSSYLVSMTYEEQLLWFCNYLEKTVIPAINTNAEALAVLQEYVENYFENLDVQEEISNKLDEMAEDGTLEALINDEIFGDIEARLDILDLKVNNKMRIHFPYLANENGDCYIMENGEKTFVVDLGRSSTTSNIVNYLVSKNLTKIDGVIITHYHGDHTGGGGTDGSITGFEAFFNSASLDFSDCIVYLPFSDEGSIYNRFVGSARYIPTAETNIKTFLTTKDIPYHEVETGEVITINSETKITFYNADNTIFNNYYDITEVKDDETVTTYNNFCSIFELECNNVYFLGTADIEEKAEELNAQYLHAPAVVKLEHHAYNPTTNKAYLDKILNAKYGIALPTNEYYKNIYRETANAFNDTQKLIWADDIEDSTIIQIDDNEPNIISKTGISNMNGSFNNHLKATNSASVFPDYGTAKNLYDDTDLDDVKEPDTYKSISSGVGTYDNCPFNGSFRLLVTRILDDEDNSRIMQILIANNDYAIYIRKLTSSGWTVWSPISFYGMGQIIPNNSDLNNYYNAGKYYIGSSANSQTISNRPTGITNAPFVLEVEYMHDKRRLRQHLYNNVGDEYVRFMTGFNESTQTPTYSAWYKYTLTTVS